jgi:hypothetical protein
VKAAAVRDVDDRFMLARIAKGAGDSSVRQAAIEQLTQGSNQAPQVAYEWLSHSLLKEGKPDDAVLAMLMATVAYDQDSVDNADLSLATFERANELRTQSALQTGLSGLKPEGDLGGKVSLMDVVAALNGVVQGALRCQEERLVADATRAFRKNLTIKPDRASTNDIRYVAGDVTFVSALGLAMLQRHEDWSYIATFLASDAYQPKFSGYLRAMVAQDAAFERTLLSHPSAMIRANALITLAKPAPPAEADILVRCAGAWHPESGKTNDAVRLMEGALEDERHVVRVMALRGLAKHGVDLPMEKIKRAMTTTDAWRKKYTQGRFVLNIDGRQYVFLSGHSASALDGTLLQTGYASIASKAALSDDEFAWLLQRLNHKPWDRDDGFSLSLAPDVDGYRTESVSWLSAERLNGEVLTALAKHASSHVEQLMAASRQSDPYGQLVLLQAAERIATNATVRPWLWRIAESGDQTPEQKAYRDKLYAEKVEEVRKGLGWNQTINYSGISDYADKLAVTIWKQSRRLAVSQLAATAEDAAEFDRLGALFSGGHTARAALLALLSRGEDFLARHAPETLLQHEDAEVRMCAAIARLSMADSVVARTVLTDALKGDEDRISFAARVALKTKTPALSEVVRSVTGMRPVSVAGYLVRRLAFDAR